MPPRWLERGHEGCSCVRLLWEIITHMNSHCNKHPPYFVSWPNLHREIQCSTSSIWNGMCTWVGGNFMFPIFSFRDHRIFGVGARFLVYGFEEVRDDPELLGDSGELPIFQMEWLAVGFLMWNLLSLWREKTIEVGRTPRAHTPQGKQ